VKCSSRRATGELLEEARLALRAVIEQIVGICKIAPINDAPHGHARILAAYTRAVELLDPDLTAEQLERKCNPHDGGEHPIHPRKVWRRYVLNQNTLSGYWDWVSHRLKQVHREPL
jgi:hypothetical protein